MLGGIRTGWIFREKADCKQFNEIRPTCLIQGLKQGLCLKAPQQTSYPPSPGPVLLLGLPTLKGSELTPTVPHFTSFSLSSMALFSSS